MNKINKFTKRLTLLFVKKDTHCYDEWLEDKFGSLIFAYDNESALSKFAKLYIDIVLIEVENNIEEKLELIRAIKQKRPFIIIAVLSKQNDFTLLNSLVDVGIDGYFEHPLDTQNTLDKFNSFKNKYELTEECEANKHNVNLLKQYQDIADKSSIISKTDASGKITYANDNFCKVSGYTKNELIGHNHNMIRHPDSKKDIFKEMWDTIKNKKQQWSGIIRNISKSGESYYVKSTISPILDSEGNIIEFIGLRDNISSILSDKKHFIDKIESNTLSFLILIQIDEFEILEKFYNLTTIDKIEKMFGFKLVSYLPKEYKFGNVYNLDNGQYALVSELDDFMNLNINVEDYLNEFIENVKSSILDIDGIEYDINISLSYAFGKYMIYEDAKAGLSDAISNNLSICHSNDFSIKHQIEAKRNLDVIKMVKIAT